jgi:polyphosphate kinase 2 (PPK2 family)
LKFTDEREEEEKRLQKRQDDPLEKFKVKKQ